MMDHRQETRIVKKALKDAGMHARVTHGTGTGYGWLKINLGDPEQRNGLEPHPRGVGMRYTEAEQATQAKALQIAQEVTGRHGEHHGEILILAQEAA